MQPSFSFFLPAALLMGSLMGGCTAGRQQAAPALPADTIHVNEAGYRICAGELQKRWRKALLRNEVYLQASKHGNLRRAEAAP